MKKGMSKVKYCISCGSNNIVQKGKDKYYCHDCEVTNTVIVLGNPSITKESCIKELINLDAQLMKLVSGDIDVGTFFDSYFPHVIDETLIVLDSGEILKSKEPIPVSDMVNKIKEKYI